MLSLVKHEDSSVISMSKCNIIDSQQEQLTNFQSQTNHIIHAHHGIIMNKKKEKSITF